MLPHFTLAGDFPVALLLLHRLHDAARCRDHLSSATERRPSRLFCELLEQMLI